MTDDTRPSIDATDSGVATPSAWHPPSSATNEAWSIRCASRHRAFEEALLAVEHVRADRRRWMDDSWQECARIIRNEIMVLQDEEVRAAKKAESAAIREMAASPEREAWQDISTAPKDRAVLALDEHERVRVILWGGHNDWLICGSLNKFEPTHWMSLPAPPTPRREESGT